VKPKILKQPGMKQTLTNPRLWVPAIALVMVIALVSWGQQQTPGTQQHKFNNSDTIPKKKSDKKIRDLDDVLEELESADLKFDMEKMHQELARAMKDLDGAKIKLEMEKAMKDVDFDKIRKEVQESMEKIDWNKMKADMNFEKFEKEMKDAMAKMELDKVKMEFDFDKMQKEIKESMEKVDWHKMKKEMEEVKNINTEKLGIEMKKLEEHLSKIEPELRESLDKAKVELEKAKVEMREYKEFVDGLEKDGLINKKEDYTIQHKNGELIVNGKKVSEQVYNKYKVFLEKRKEFTIEKENDDFNIDLD
jgi:hypothetical protein